MRLSGRNRMLHQALGGLPLAAVVGRRQAAAKQALATAIPQLRGPAEGHWRRAELTSAPSAHRLARRPRGLVVLSTPDARIARG